MQVNDLTRTLNHILIGSLTLCAILFLFGVRIETFIIYVYLLPQVQILEPKDITPLAPLAAALLLALTPIFLSISFLLGIAVEGFADLLIQELFIYRVVYKFPRVQQFFFLRNSYLLTAQLKAHYQEQLSKSEKYHLPETTAEERRTFSASLFFQFASQDQIKWTLYNYSVYLLSAGFSLVTILLIAGVLVDGIASYWIIPLIISLYALLFVAADRERYSYESIYRFCILHLAKNEQNIHMHDTAKNEPALADASTHAKLVIPSDRTQISKK